MKYVKRKANGAKNAKKRNGFLFSDSSELARVIGLILLGLLILLSLIYILGFSDEI